MDIGADGDPAAVAGVIRGVPGVVPVTPSIHQDRRLLDASPRRRRRGRRVLSALIASGHTPWLVRDRGMELDEIYQRYFAAGGRGGAGGGGMSAMQRDRRAGAGRPSTVRRRPSGPSRPAGGSSVPGSSRSTC